MPRVPILTGPSVRTAPLNAPQTSAAAEGAGVAAGLGVVAETLGGLAEISDRADRAVVDNAEVGFASEVDQLFTNEAQTGFLQQRGVNVRDAYQKLGEQFDAAEQRALSQLNGRQRELFRQSAAKTRLLAMRRADDYLDRELNAVEDANSKALQNTAFSRIAMDAADPGAVESYVEEIRTRATRDAERAGLDAPAREALVAQGVSTARYTQIVALANADRLDQAQQMLEAYGDQITDPQQRDRAQKLVEQESQRVRAQRETDRIVAEAGPDQRKAVTAARQLTGTLRDDVEQRVSAYYRQQEQLLKQEQNAAIDAAASRLEQTGNLNFLRGAELQTIRQIPGAMQALQARAKQLQGGAGGADADTNWDVYTRLVTDARTNPAALIDVNPALVRPYLGDTEFKWFVDARAQAMAGNGDGARRAGQTEFSLQDLVLDQARSMDLISRSGTISQLRPGDQRIVNAALSAARQQIIEAERRGPISPAAKLDIVRGVVSEQAKTDQQPPVPSAPMAEPVTNVNIATWSSWIASQGGTPSAAKINRLIQVGRRMQPPAYTDADRQAEMIRIAREP